MKIAFDYQIFSQQSYGGISRYYSTDFGGNYDNDGLNKRINDLEIFKQKIEEVPNSDDYNKFYDKTGVPALVNTSFNLHGKPIVNNLQDALHVFENSGLDVLWLDNHIIEKIA